MINHSVFFKWMRANRGSDFDVQQFLDRLKNARSVLEFLGLENHYGPGAITKALTFIKREFTPAVADREFQRLRTMVGLDG